MKELAKANMEDVIKYFVQGATDLGLKILVALIVFIVGRMLIGLVNKLVRKVLDKRNIDPSVKTFLKSLTNITLMVLLIISVINTLGVATTSFAALLASAGVAIGMALSGNLQNFAGGLIILLIKPYKVGDVVEAQNVTGSVREIQIFHTILSTFDNKIIYIPNGSLSNGVLINYSHQTTRRVDWTFSIDYGENFEKVKGVIEELLAKDARILLDPAPFIALHTLASSSVNVTVRVWVKSEDYWAVYYEINKTVYATFNEKGISFPFPQLTVHQSK